MSALTARRRGDLAEEMLPVAARLAVLVHGEGGPEDVQEVLEGLDDQQQRALIVVLAGLVDPEQPLGKALGWLDSTEDGALTVPPWGEPRRVRDVAADAPETDDEVVDEVAVRRYVDGDPVIVTDAERLAAVLLAAARGVTYLQLDERHGLRKGTTSTFVSRLRKRYRDEGREFPQIQGTGPVELTDAQVVAMRKAYAAGGVTDLDLSMRYQVTRQTVTRLLSGARRAEVGGPLREKRSVSSTAASRQLFNGHTGLDGAAPLARAS